MRPLSEATTDAAPPVRMLDVGRAALEDALFAAVVAPAPAAVDDAAAAVLEATNAEVAGTAYEA